MAPDRPDRRLSGADVWQAARFVSRLPGFLRHPVSPESARRILRQRLDGRERDFLALMRTAVYRHPASPYATLLRAAGCEYGDLEQLVRTDGLEDALRRLSGHGVFLSVDEFKGRRPVVRRGVTIAVDPERLRNPGAQAHVPARSSGSRGPGTAADVDLAFVRELAVNHCLALGARGGARWRYAIWSVPGTAAMKRLLWLAGFGVRPVRWFSPVDPASSELHPRYRWSARAMRAVSLLAGVPFPAVAHVPADDPGPIVRWMRDVIATGQTPHLSTFSSGAVRVAERARAAGIDLRRAKFTVSGEPITPARLAMVRRTGAEVVPQYGASEAGGTIGHGCLRPSEADDVHLFHDLRAVVHPADPGAGTGASPRSLLVTSLRPTTPIVLLNVSLGDRAVLESRACGCALGDLGWVTHLHTIRSEEKLTAGGMNFLDADLIDVLERVLPGRFGGGPTDYQLVEEEGVGGQPRLRLLVHPAVGPLPERAVIEALLAGIGHGSGVERVTALVWREFGVLRVERRAPETGLGGKVLHLHVRPRRAHASPERSREVAR